MAGSISQFPFTSGFDRLYKKLGLANILVISALVFALRMFLHAFWLTPYTLILLWVLHGFNYIIIYLCLVEYVSGYIPKELRTRGQMMNSIILGGISSMAGGYLGARHPRPSAWAPCLPPAGPFVRLPQ